MDLVRKYIVFWMWWKHHSCKGIKKMTNRYLVVEIVGLSVLENFLDPLLYSMRLLMGYCIELVSVERVARINWQ
jgi:hypothetical protein